jgi:23S rRNA (cytidine2498-2'-O)-methyltransferase
MFGCELDSTSLQGSLHLAFVRQMLPDVRALEASSVAAWVRLLVDGVAGVLPDHRPWSLHVYPFVPVLGSSRMGARAWHTRGRAAPSPVSLPEKDARAGASANRCRLIREGVLERLHERRRHLVRYLRQHEGSFGEDESLVQLVLTAPEHGFLSVAAAPFPFEQRHVLSHLPAGEVPIAVDKSAPSRAFAKLVEAETRLGRRIAARETCVDLGAAPGSWTYVAARRGAQVTAVDRAELRPDLARLRNVKFEQGDAFRFEPKAAADWLLCDVIAAAERSADLLTTWLRKRWCRRFVVTLKVDDTGSIGVLSRLKRELPELTREFWLTRLCSNKKEVCAFGTIAD